MSATLILLVITVVFLGALMRSTFGFGEAVMSMPLLALLPIRLHTAVSLMGLVGLTVAVFNLAAGGWKHIDRRILLRLGVATVVGIPVGLTMVALTPVDAITGVLGGVLIIYGVYSLINHLFRKKTDRPLCNDDRWALLFGFAAGVLGSAYNFNGVPVAVYGTLRQWPPARFRSTLQAHFLISGVLIVIGQMLGGLWTTNLFMLYGLSLPAMATATAIGTILHRKIPTAKFQRYVFLLIVALGTLLLIRSA